MKAFLIAAGPCLVALGVSLYMPKVEQAPHPRVARPTKPGETWCPDCGGTGKDGLADCDYCKGSGISMH